MEFLLAYSQSRVGGQGFIQSRRVLTVILIYVLTVSLVLFIARLKNCITSHAVATNLSIILVAKALPDKVF